MKTTLALLLASLTCLTTHAAEKLDATLQKGLFEEEGNQNFEAAIQAYQSLVAAHDNDRKTAATAIYRLGECYRKLGRTNEAITQFQRILAAFSDQPTLAMLSRQNLVGLGADSSAPSSLTSGGPARRQSLEQTLAAQRAEAAAANDLYQRLQKMSSAELRRSLPTVAPDTLLSRLLEQASQIEQKLASLTVQFSKEHPSVVAETNALATVQKQIDQRIGGILEGLKFQATTAQQREEALQAELYVVEARAGAGHSGSRLSGLDETSRAKMKEMLQQELQITEKLLAEQKKKVEAGTLPPGEDVRVERDVLGVKRQLLAVDGLATPADRKQWREWLMKEIQLAEQAADIEKKKLAAGRSTIDFVAPLQREVLVLKRELLEFDARPSGTTTTATDSTPAVTSEEEGEIRRIKSIISNSPDLINTPNPASFTPLHTAASKGQLVVARFLLDSGALLDQQTLPLTSGVGPVRGQTPLALACDAGHKAMAEFLLSRGANPNSVNQARDTPLHLAAKKGFVSVAEVLIRNKAQVDPKNAEGDTPLHSAVEAGQTPMALALLKAGADVNATIAGGQTALHLAAARGNTELVSSLLERGAKLDAVDQELLTPLFVAMAALRDGRAAGNPTDVVRLLLEKGASIDRSPPATSFLHLAVACNSPEILKLILDRKPRIDALNSTELTPLQSAVVDSMSPEIIPLLVKAGADVRQRISSTSSAKTRHRSGHEMNVNGQPPLTVAISRMDLPMTEALLENGADVNLTADNEYGYTPLMSALWTKSQAPLDLVLRYKPDLAAQTRNQGMTALHLAVDISVSAAATLLKAGAPVNATDFAGRTPLHQATAMNSIEMAELLLKNGANPNAMTLDGQRPLSIARAKPATPSPGRRFPPTRFNPNSGSRPDDIVTLLLKHGADELLLRQQVISVTRASRNYDAVYFRKGTNEYNRHTLFELLATVYAAGSHLPFPELRQVTIERLQPDRSTRNITVDLVDRTKSDHACTNDIWLEWGDRVEIPEADHPLSMSWGGLDSLLVGRVAQCLQRSVEIVSKSGTNRFELRAQRTNRAGFSMDSFRLYEVLNRSGLGNATDWPIRVTRKGTATDPPTILEFN
ncbi:MAG TPA: ankyrin repeat domain-containing protein, partial [Verrucomicrobiae bacterium]|nr:ankyrin repeat domain-containing protein [Verrucomicrobiae bacterium]